jgi:Spy/CpxP family protein refolding chaperone
LAAVVVLIVGVGIAAARASYPQGYGWHAHGPLGLIANQLKLNADQKTQIQSIWQAESPTVASLIREFAAEQKQMNSARGRQC